MSIYPSIPHECDDWRDGKCSRCVRRATVELFLTVEELAAVVAALTNDWRARGDDRPKQLRYAHWYLAGRLHGARFRTVAEEAT